MSYHIRTDNFEGPFDLLLYLVSRQRVDIGSVRIAEITEQYLAEVAALKIIDLDVASDFLIVASTLLEIKAQSLLPKQNAFDDEEIEELSPSEARDLLVERLIVYKQFKNVATELSERMANEAMLHRRTVGPDESLLGLLPDYLEGQTIDGIAVLAMSVFSRQDPFLLDSDHIARKQIPVEAHVRSIHARIKQAGRLRFSDLVTRNTSSALVVVTFLAVLELYKRNMIVARQPEPFGDIELDFLPDSGELTFEGDMKLTSVEEE